MFARSDRFYVGSNSRMDEQSKSLEKKTQIMRQLPEYQRYYVHEAVERLPEWRIADLRPD